MSIKQDDYRYAIQGFFNRIPHYVKSLSRGKLVWTNNICKAKLYDDHYLAAKEISHLIPAYTKNNHNVRVERVLIGQ